MNIRRLPLTQLHAAPYNPRLALKPGDSRYERLARSLAEFELVQPLVWNERTGNLVGGHQRLEVLRRQGVAEVECVVVNLPLEREKALNIALNNSDVGGDWEPDRLTSLLEELCDLPDFDATLTGFDEQQLNDLLFRPADNLDNADDDLESDLMTATLEVHPEDWAKVQTRLDDLLAALPRVRLHIRMPDAPRATSALKAPAWHR